MSETGSMFFKARHYTGHNNDCHSGMHRCLALLLLQYILISLAHFSLLQIEPGANYTGLQYYLCAPL